MPQEAVKKRFEFFVDSVRRDLRRIHGEDLRVIIIKDKTCPFHLEASLDYQTLKIRCVLGRPKPEDVRLCLAFRLGRHQNFVRQIAYKNRGERGYKTILVDNLVNGEVPHLE